MATGTVKWFVQQKGYGFIKDDEDEQDLFCHHSNCGEDYLIFAKGSRVTYEKQDDPKGPTAVNCRLIKD